MADETLYDEYIANKMGFNVGSEKQEVPSMNYYNCLQKYSMFMDEADMCIAGNGIIP